MPIGKGQTLLPNTVRSLNDFENIDKHITGVYSLLKTKAIEKGLGMYREKYIQVVSAV